jgi:hypothetical protein
MSSMSSKDAGGWESCQVPRLMFLDLEDRGKQGLISRELRLFACACCKHADQFMDDGRSLQAVDVAERYADGDASRDELKAAYDAARLVERSIAQRIKQINSAAEADVGGQDTDEWRLFNIDDWHPEGRRRNAALAASLCADTKVITSRADPALKYCGDMLIARATALFAYQAGASRDRLELMEAGFLSDDDDYLMYEDAWQADLVRCVFRNPFRPIAADELDVEPRVRDMAESLYRLRAFDRMPVLGKELEVSGCVDHDLVSHCINAHVHARGCWALDMARGFKRDGKACQGGDEGGDGVRPSCAPRLRC